MGLKDLIVKCPRCKQHYNSALDKCPKCKTKNPKK